MLNGRNWWTNSDVSFEYKENFEERLDMAIDRVWKEDIDDGDPCVFGLSHFRDGVKSVLKIINFPPQETK